MELPYKLIQLYTYKHDVVLDPFCGSGPAFVAAIKAARHFVGYDIDPNYVRMSEKRISQAREQKSAEIATIPLLPKKELGYVIAKDGEESYELSPPNVEIQSDAPRRRRKRNIDTQVAEPIEV